MTKKPQASQKVVLLPNALYSTDNGRIVCGGHAGMTAQRTGRDLSGKPVVRVTDAAAEQWQAAVGQPIACEDCGRTHEPKLSAKQRTGLANLVAHMRTPQVSEAAPSLIKYTDSRRWTAADGTKGVHVIELEMRLIKTTAAGVAYGLVRVLSETGVPPFPKGVTRQVSIAWSSFKQNIASGAITPIKEAH